MGKISDQIKIGFKKNWWLQKRNKGATVIIFLLPILMAAMAGFFMRTGLGSVKRTLVNTQSFSSDILESVPGLNECVDKGNMTACTIAVLARPLGGSNRTDEIVNNFRTLARYQKMDLPVKIYQSQDEILQGYANNTVWAGVELEELQEGFNYTIRLAEDFLPGSTDSDEMFLTSGFVGLQSFIERAILMTTVPSHNVTSFYSASKYPFWKQDKPPNSLANSFASMLNYSYMLAFLVPLVQIVKEKQSKLKEFMKIAGLTEMAYWLSWLCMQLVFVAAPLVLCSCSIYLVIGAELQTPFLAFFLLNVGYVVSSIMFSFFIPVIISSAQLASVTATLWFTVLGLLSSFLLDTGFVVQLAASFIAPMGFYCALMKIFVNEASNSPWAAVWFSTEEMTTGNFAAILFIDAIIYSILLLYLSNVIPQGQGIRKPFYFCFLPRYWKSTPKQLDEEEESLILNEQENDYELREGIEKLNANQPLGIQIRKLNKIYPGKQDEKVVAVNNLSMDIGTNQILALLGHNGAGKSTTISILTGMTSATSGEVLINGLDINENIDGLRKVMGYCPQKDLLFDELTGEQHLRIFAKLRGVDDDVLDHVVIRALENVDLIEKKDTIVKEYSGGMKRRLSLAIATIGPVKVVFLDEPTSGLDPTSRAHLWDTLKKFKEGKTIILTTHYMEEADVLGDRIAIIANGKLKCYGTPLFLKQRFGIGYYLNIAKAEFFSMSNFTKFIKELYPTASLAQENDADMTILLPNSESALLLNLLKALEQDKKEPVHSLGIESYGISMTSLEDVFLKITADESEHSDEPTPTLKLGEHSINVEEDDVDHIAGSAAALDAAEGTLLTRVKQNVILTPQPDTKQSSFVTKMNALVKARVIYQIRSWKMLLVFLLLPSLTLLFLNLIFTTQQRLNNNIDTNNDAVPESFSFVEFLPFTIPFSGYYVPRKDLATFLNATHSLSSDPNGIKFLEFETYHNLQNYLTGMLNSSVNGTIDPEFGFGALSFAGLNTTKDYYNANFYYNKIRHGSLPALINMFHSAVLAIHAGPEVAKTYLKVNSNPFPQATGSILMVVRESTNAYLIAVELCALGVLLAKKVLSERLHQTRLLINVTGTPPFIYWISNLIVDGTLTFISVFMACIIGFLVQIGGLTPDLLPSIALIAVGFTLSYTSWAYVCTFMFNKVETLQKWLGLINMVTLLPSGLIFLPYPYSMLSNLTPPSAVATAFVHLANLKDQSRVFNQENYFAFLDPSLGICWTLLFFLGQSVLFFAILVIVDSLHNYHKRLSLYDNALPPRDDIDMDDDVRQEKDRIWNDQHNPKDVVKALNIYKVYNQDVTAVKGVTMGIQNNICFGLLGPNGAGKTTTIAMLTAQTSTSHGDILLHNVSCHNISVSKLYRQIALNCCLQSNKALMGFLTVREQLELYVKLRAGLTSAQVSHHVTTLLHRTGLNKYEKKLTKTLSGGNKRKLSLAISMAWGSKIILLDEPSSGMDPLARRQLWHEIRYVKNNNTCVLLTTHSMDEAEAICDRIAIMVKGQIRCIGSPQHLKHKFGSGYRLLLTYSQEKQLEVHNFVTSHFAGCKLLEAMDGFRMYDVGAVGNNLAELFALVEENKQALSISNWAISQTSLKQVFLHLTKQQNEQQPLFS